MGIPLSVVIITKNEETRLARCLESVNGWAGEIIIIDDESTDNTRDIANCYADKVLVRRMINEGKHRNWAYSQAANNWVLSIDADEIPDQELKNAIAETLKNPQYTHYSIPYKNYIGDYPLKSDVGKSIVKLFRKDKFRYEEVEVHPRIFSEGQCGRVEKGAMHHYSWRDFGDFLRKTDKQTTLEAKKWFDIYKTDPKRAEAKMNLLNAMWRYNDRFWRTYISKKAWKDGFIGFMISFFGGLYQIMSYAKYWEMKKSIKT